MTKDDKIMLLKAKIRKVKELLQKALNAMEE